MEFVQQPVHKFDKGSNAAPDHPMINNTKIYYNPGTCEWLEERNKHNPLF